MNDVIHEIISMSNDDTIYDQYKNSEIKDNNETNDVQNDKKQDNILDTKNKSVDSRIANENSISNIIVNTEIDNNKDSDNDKPIDIADINANKEKLKSVNKRLLNKQMYNNKILDAITPISYNINNKLYRLLLNNPNKLLDVLGLMGKNIIQDSFIHNDWLPNSPITIQKKKSSKPLIDTGLLRKSIDHEVI